MSQIVLLITVMVWMGRSPAARGERLEPWFGNEGGPAVFLCAYALLVLGLAAWGRLLARHTGERRLRTLGWFNRVVYVSRWLVPAWLALGVYRLGWDQLVLDAFAGIDAWPWRGTHVELPQAMVGILPALLTWIGLVWAQFPLDRALREQGILLDLENDLPIRQPPTLRQSIGSVMRLQVAVTLLPVSLILVVRDLTTITIWAVGFGDPQGSENWAIIPATVAIFIFAPELLRRVLKSEPLPAGPLRTRLEAMCRDAGLKYRQIMLWHTEGMMGNASVMGLIPQVRYILLSDLLLETMTERQVEAVFAHELGHVVHRHFLWYGIFAAMIMGFVAGPGDLALTHVRGWVTDWARAHQWTRPEQHWNELEGLIAVAISMSTFLLAFRYLSPRFERQADVFAARTMQRIGARAIAEETQGLPPDTPLETPATVLEIAPDQQLVRSNTPPRTSEPTIAETEDPASGNRSHQWVRRRIPTYVGEYGAGVFASALHRVAVINRTPVSAGSSWHGSIADRMRYLHEISSDPAHTYRFDRLMNRLYATLLVALCTFGIWGAVHSASPGEASRLQVISPTAGAGIRR